MSQYKKELINRTIVDALCELHRQILDSTKSTDRSDPLMADVRKLMDAINTLEALCRHDNAASFFEQVCSPSRDEKARKMTETYQKGDFAKRAMLRYMFKDSDFAADDEFDRSAATATARPWQQRACSWTAPLAQAVERRGRCNAKAGT